MQRVVNEEKLKLARSHEHNIYRKPLVTLKMMFTHEFQTLTPGLQCLQQIFSAIKTVAKVILGYTIELRFKTKKRHVQELFSFHKIDNLIRGGDLLYQTSGTWSIKRTMLIWKAMKSRASWLRTLVIPFHSVTQRERTSHLFPLHQLKCNT